MDIIRKEKESSMKTLLFIAKKYWLGNKSSFCSSVRSLHSPQPLSSAPAYTAAAACSPHWNSG